MICGDICQHTASPAGHGAPEDAENPNSTAMSVSCSVRMMWRTAVSLVTGKAI